jgi:branched-chain amino acid aminotransferase
MPLEEATIPVADDGLIRGDGVFEVVRVYDGRPFALREHLARLERSGRNLQLPVDLEAVRADLHRLLAAAGPQAQEVRVILTRGGRRVLIVERVPELPERIRLRTVRYQPTLVLDGVKSLSYAANMLARRIAVAAGADDALLVSADGRVLEAPTASFFWVADGELFTPPLSEHILASITRAVVLEVSGAQERVCSLAELGDAEEMFLASTAREVHPVASLDEWSFDRVGPVSARTATAVAERIEQLLAAGAD